ncbi:RNA-metabolising metallo-beta-lactamase [Desulfofundulus kuznetsovii DSM 6115]|uniref:RNA-metabolising metallo-beta-lactamase n=1 Tax=Desulfofundulus kuznetsovii (strain DSM 6115 / VKM B-1805 / 17) TaxID=760568 RepID=A0AAU8P9X7_DESK7|nr:RNA-metabolising metallo-beta-lactamase [Desulfofundulus kuznetsovii DSM 6115]
MRVRFLGAAQTVTGSCFLLEVGANRLMVDCGMFQGPRTLRERNYRPFPVSPLSVDYVLLTHAHIDHSGLIPKLVKHGFRGKVLATPATIDLCAVMLPDSGHIQEMEVERLNRKAARAGRPLIEPIYNVEDAHRAMNFFQPVDYGQTVNLTKEISVRFLEAGHILGSAMVELTVREGRQETKLLFTGDLGKKNKPFLKDPSFIDHADYVFIESTYGDRLHPDQGDHVNLLHDIIWETYRKGGNLIIPAFAVERTQDLLYDLNLLIVNNRFPPMKVYIDSPMAVAATEVFKKYTPYFDQETRELIAQGKDPLNMTALEFTRTTEESMALNKIKSGAIIIAASGMCEAGRIKHHLRHNLWRPECTVLFVGYQAPGTKGRKIKDGAKYVRIHGEEVAVRATIKSIDSFSAHADKEELLEWLGHLQKPPTRVFLVHGEPSSMNVLAQDIARRYGYSVHVPVLEEEVQLTPALPLGEEELRRAYDAVASRLQDVLASGLGRGHYQEIMEQLDHLNALLASIQKQAS